MSPKNRRSNNLVALGSAAVLGVYAVGFVRTEPAARRLDEESDERRPPPAAPAATAPAVAATPALPTSAPPKPTAPPRRRAESSKKPADSARTVVVAAPDKKPDSVVAQTVPLPVPAPATPARADTVRVAPVAVAPPVDTVPKDSVIVYKDGVYFGWGTSRHGDIQMGIEIKEGRIKSAFISECNTQYDCSWINHLPKQVVARQSAEVDFVSGATQSANALYRAVVNALKQAR